MYFSITIMPQHLASDFALPSLHNLNNPFCAPLCRHKIQGKSPDLLNRRLALLEETRELKQQRRRQLWKRHLKGTVALLQTLSHFFGNFFWNWILKDCIQVQDKKLKSLPCVHVFHKRWNQASSRRSRAVTAKKCTRKKRDAGAALLFRQSKPIAFLQFSLTSPSSLLKFPNVPIQYTNSPLKKRGDWTELVFSKTYGIVTGDAPVSYWPFFPCPQTVPGVFAQLTYLQSSLQIVEWVPL